jgi:uncharacterized protein (DUF1015 family)
MEKVAPFRPETSRLCRDQHPCFYFYRQWFYSTGGKQECREGLMGLLAAGARPAILRHEEITGEGLEACLRERNLLHAETSSLFLWCEDADGELRAELRDCPSEPFRTYQDRFGCRHELHRVADGDSVERLKACLGQEPLYLADGHHRFAAGWSLATIQVRSPALLPFPMASPEALLHLEGEARAGRLLRPKSTDFRPKLAARLLWHEI